MCDLLNPRFYGNRIVKVGDLGHDIYGGPSGMVFSFCRGGYVGWNAVGEVRWSTVNGYVDGIGINPGPVADHFLIENNYVWNCDGPGYYDYVNQQGPGGSDIYRYNVAVNCGLKWRAGGFSVGRDGPATHGGFQVYNNTFIHFSHNTPAVQFDSGVLGANYFANNIVVSSGATVLENQADGFWTVRGNQYWDLDGTANFKWGANTYPGLSAFRNGTGMEANAGFEENPQLQNANSVVVMNDVSQLSTMPNYKPAPGAPVYNRGLNLSTLYGFQVGTRDAAGNTLANTPLAIGAYVSAGQPNSGDSTAPVISQVAADVTGTQAVITWTTDESADSQVVYGLSATYGSQTPVSSSRVTAHSVVLTALQANTVHHFAVRSRDVAGNLAVSPNFTFFVSNTPPVTPPPVTPSDSNALVAHWTFDDQGGDSAADASGNGNAGTLLGELQRIEGKINSALVLNGTDTQVRAANTSVFEFGATDSFTLAAWIKTEPGFAMTMAFAGKHVSGSAPGYFLGTMNTEPASLMYRLRDRDGKDSGYQYNPNLKVGDGEWHHVALVVDRTAQTAALFLDGNGPAAVSSISWLGSFANGDWNARFSVGSSGLGFARGTVDDVRVYARALTAADVQAIHAGVVANPEPELPTPSITQTFLNGSNALQINFDGGTGASYKVQGSTNLVDWVDLGPAENVNGEQYRFVDHSWLEHPVRYYRITKP